MKLSRIIMLSLLVLTVVVASFGCQAAQRPEPARYGDQNLNGGARGAAEYDRVGDGQFGGGANNLGMRDNANGMGGRNGAQDTTNRRLEERVEQIAGVRNATVIVEGNTAYVGLELEQGAQQARNGQQRNGRQAQGVRNQMFPDGPGRQTINPPQQNRAGQNNLQGQGQIGQGLGQAGQAGQPGQAGLTGGQTADVEQIKQQVRQVLAQEGQFRNIVISEEATFTRELGGIANEIRTGRPVADFGDALRDLGRTLTPSPVRTR